MVTWGGRGEGLEKDMRLRVEVPNKTLGSRRASWRRCAYLGHKDELESAGQSRDEEGGKVPWGRGDLELEGAGGRKWKKFRKAGEQIRQKNGGKEPGVPCGWVWSHSRFSFGDGQPPW